jgi:thioesterase domain-containing protein
LDKAPLMRATLFRLSDRDHALLLVLHHIIVDEWSLKVLERDLHEIVAALLERRPVNLPPLRVSYADFAEWQRERLKGDMVERQTAYWRRALAGAPATLDLPTDRPRPAVQDYEGASEPFVVPRERWERLQALGREEQATPFMTLLAAFVALLHRLTGQSDLLVGAPISGRTRAVTEDVVGFFQNTLVLRATFDSPAPTFRELIRQTRENALNAYSHADLPFQQIAAAASRDRDYGRTPLFQVMLVLHEPRGATNTCEPSLAPVDTGTSKMDLTLYLVEEGGGLSGELEYNTGLFDTHTARGWIRELNALLETLGREPDRAVGLVRKVESPVDARTAKISRGHALPGSAGGDAPPRNAVEAQLLAIWREVLRRPAIGAQDDFFLTGGNSLAAAHMFALVESRLGVTLPLSALIQRPTIASLTEVIVARTQGDEPQWQALHVLTDAPGLPLVCVHGIGGDVLSFKDLARYLGPDQAFIGVQAILSERVGEIYETLEATAAAYVAALRVRQPTGPYYLAGMSAGASVALEMAQQLRSAGQHVAMLTIFDGSPANSGVDLRRLGIRNLGRLVANLPRWVRDDLLLSTPSDVAWRTQQKLASGLRGATALMTGRTNRSRPNIRDVVNFPQRGERWEIFLDKHDRALRQYVPRAYDGPVTVFKARTHPLFWTNDCERVWQRLSPDVDVREVPGTHLSMLHEPHVRVLAAELRDAIRGRSAAAL